MEELWQWPQVLNALSQFGLALLLTLPIALERESATGTMGLRTFPLVVLASCGYVLAARNIVGESPEAQARIIEGLMTGIGFIGGGAILKQSDTVYGTATAASIWTTGALGAAVAFEEYEIAVVLSLLTVAILQLLKPLRRFLGSRGER